MAVNEPSPRVKPKDKVCLRCHKSLATPCYNCYNIISHLIGPDRYSGVCDESIVTVTMNKSMNQQRKESKRRWWLAKLLLILVVDLNSITRVVINHARTFGYSVSTSVSSSQTSKQSNNFDDNRQIFF